MTYYEPSYTVLLPIISTSSLPRVHSPVEAALPRIPVPVGRQGPIISTEDVEVEAEEPRTSDAPAHEGVIDEWESDEDTLHIDVGIGRVTRNMRRFLEDASVRS